MGLKVQLPIPAVAIVPVSSFRGTTPRGAVSHQLAYQSITRYLALWNLRISGAV